MSDNANKENVMTNRAPLTTITNQSNVFKRGLMVKGKDSVKSLPKVSRSSKSTQTEVQYSEVSCGTSDHAAEAMISALTGGPLNETYFESLAEQRREALEITIEENEELYKKIEELNLSLTETTKRAEEAERQLILLKSKAPVPENLDISHEEEEQIKSLLSSE
ncbi:hypothetical protein ACHWQZ_G018249 [Mnemiopsis leidyi]